MKQLLFLLLVAASIGASAQTKTYRHTIKTPYSIEFRHNLAAEIDSTEADSVQAVAYQVVLIDADSGSVNVWPPVNPAPGDWFSVVDSRGSANTNSIVIKLSAAKYHSAAADLTLSAARSSGTLVYVNSTVGWVKLD